MTQSISIDKVIQILKQAAAVLEVTDTSPVKVFRVRAYQTAIQSLENLDEDLTQLVRDQKLHTVPGIGKELSQKITDLVTLGQSPALDKLFKTVPEGMFPLLEIPGIGPHKAFKLATAFKLTDAGTALVVLKNQAQNIGKLEGFGLKSAQEILVNLDRFKPKSTRMRLDQADTLAQKVITILKSLPGVDHTEALGSVRRRQDTVGDVDIVVSTHNPDLVISGLRQTPKITRFTATGENLARVILGNNKQVDIKFQTPQKFGATLQHFTGSKAHNIALRELALKQNKSLSEHGIKYRGKLVEFTGEVKFYENLNIDWIPPELRENLGEIAAAQTHSLPHLVELKDIRGDFHTHTDYPWKSSHDYGMPLGTLLDYAHKLKYAWIAVGDHNLSRQYSPGEMVAEIKKRNLYIDDNLSSWKRRVKNSPLILLRTLEVDILPSGDLAIPDQALEELDFVIISIHSRFNLPETDQTKRLLTALRRPNVKIIGHPTGRLINERPSMAIDWPQIFTACKQFNVALEINANPSRLDLPDSLVRQAIAMGVKLALGTDSHDPESLSTMSYGVSVARRGWCQKSDIINSYTPAMISSWLKSTK